jgi:hypothetical protein
MSDALIAETARAWHIHPKKVAEIADWVERKANPDYQALVFTKMLRKYMGTHNAKGENHERVYRENQRPTPGYYPLRQPAGQGSAHSQQTLFALPAKGNGSS